MSKAIEKTEDDEMIELTECLDLGFQNPNSDWPLEITSLLT